MFQVGDVVGSYTILAHLRTGGMADLFLARRAGAAGFRRLVAVKVLHEADAEDPHLVRMFLDEALITARIDHPNVVHVEDLGEGRDGYYLVMEYVHGCSLAQLMGVLGKLRRRLSPLVAVAIAARVAEGLHAAHETTDDEGQLIGLVHRDVSPQNILLSHKGHVKLIDFGVAKAQLRSETTNVAMLKGKVRYMPPEQATTGIVDRRSDVYSLGIVLWELLTMRRLFAGKTELDVLALVRSPVIEPPSQYAADLSPELEKVVLAALSRDPAQRPQTAKQFRRMLAKAEPRAMALDSAHLADLVNSVVGEELEARRHGLPKEISRLLEAEQLRAALAEAERDADAQDRTESIVEVMTLHSDMVMFEEDELDRTPDVVKVVADARTRPGGPASIARAIHGTAELGVLSSSEAVALDVPTLEDADPTLVGTEKERTGGPGGRPIPPPRPRPPSGAQSYVTHDEDSENIATMPFQKPEGEGDDEPTQPPRLASPAFPVPVHPEAARALDPTDQVRQPPAPRWPLFAVAVLVSAAFGTALALAWPLFWRAPPAPEPTPLIPGPAITPLGPLDAGRPPDAGRGAPPDAGVDAGPPPEPSPRRRGRARSRRMRDSR